MTPAVYRAPLRSRRDDVAHAPAVRHALAAGLCGVGGRLEQPPDDLEAALHAVARVHDDRVAARLERFAEAPDGSYVWTREPGGSCFLGRLTGPWSYAGDATAYAHDLTHVRPCAWLADPVPWPEVPAAVVATFERGGRNFQRIHHPEVAAQTVALWPGRG